MAAEEAEESQTSTGPPETEMLSESPSPAEPT